MTKAKTPTYKSWSGMHYRCSRTSGRFFTYYGSRGITVCDRWKIFENFVEDMGIRPPGTSLDRYPNNDGNYEPGNCRWATKQEQADNRSSNRLLTRNGVTMTAKQWAAEAGIDYHALIYRLDHGYGVEQAFEPPHPGRRTV